MASPCCLEKCYGVGSIPLLQKQPDMLAYSAATERWVHIIIKSHCIPVEFRANGLDLNMASPCCLEKCYGVWSIPPLQKRPDMLAYSAATERWVHIIIKSHCIPVEFRAKLWLGPEHGQPMLSREMLWGLVYTTSSETA